MTQINCLLIQLPCREKTCGQRGLWRAQRADTPLVCSCRCCNRTYPCPACPNPSSSLKGRLKVAGGRQQLLTTINMFTTHVYNTNIELKCDMLVNLLMAWSRFMLLLFRASSAGSLCNTPTSFSL